MSSAWLLTLQVPTGLAIATLLLLRQFLAPRRKAAVQSLPRPHFARLLTMVLAMALAGTAHLLHAPAFVIGALQVAFMVSGLEVLRYSRTKKEDHPS